MKDWLHITGVSGKVTSQIAVLFKDKGWFVTGSDVQFFPPASTVLEEADIPTVEGYNYKHLTKPFWEATLGQSLKIPNYPTRAIIVESASHKNKEYLFAKKNNIQMQPFSQLLGEFLVKEESIVVVGTAGKTTTTGLIAHTLQELGEDPSFMVGGDVITLKRFIHDSNSNYSVLEGDEYHNPDFSNGPKFLEYSPKYVVITNIGWEHQDVFPTKKKYVEAFSNLVKKIPKNGLIVAKANDENIDTVLEEAKCKVIRFDFGDGNYYQVRTDKKKYSIRYLKENISGTYNVLGSLNALNFAATVLLLSNIPSISKKYSIQDITKAASLFKGVKKRLELKYDKKGISVIDDFAPAPNRVKKSLEAILEHFPKRKIVAIFEPNSGSRVRDESVFAEMYADAFSGADYILIPTLSSFNEELLTTQELKEGIATLHPHSEVRSVTEDQLLDSLEGLIDENKKIVFVFYSSYRLQEVQDRFVEKLSSNLT